MENFDIGKCLNTKAEASNIEDSSSLYTENFLQGLEAEKEVQVERQNEKCGQLIKELLGISEGGELSMDFDLVCRDIAAGRGFSEEVKLLLSAQSANLNGVSIDEFYKAWKSGMDSFPLMSKIIQTNDNSQKESLMKGALAKQKDLEKYYDEKSLKELAGNLFGFIDSEEDLKAKMTSWNSLSREKQLKILTGIVEGWSKSCEIPAPKIIALNFSGGIRGIGCKNEIEINLSTIPEFHDVMMVLSHEFTHCLQDYGKTPSGGKIQESKDNYVNAVSFENDTLNKMGWDLYNNSLLEKEAFYVGNCVKKMLQEKVNKKSAYL